MLIGVTGPAGSGKDTVADHLKQKGFAAFSLSDIIREFCAKKGVETTRENLIENGKELREKFGTGYLAEETLKKITGNAVITSIRHPDEVNELRKNPDFVLLLVDAPLETRYARTQTRNQRRPEDKDSFKQFKKHEETEKSGTGPGQQLDVVAKMADDTIINNGTFEELSANIEKFLAKWQSKK